MKTYTFWDKIRDTLWFDRINSIEYYFAKKWLNKNFGKQFDYEDVYWGEVISDWYNISKKYSQELEQTDYRVLEGDK